jgi:hypothetical protein
MTWIPSLMVAGGAQPPQLHDLLHSPVGLWQFDGDLTDSSGNGFDLSLAAGTLRYGPGIRPDLQSLFCDGSTRVSRVTEATLRITGDVTVALLAHPNEGIGGAGETFVTLQKVGEDPEQNVLFNLEMLAGNLFHSFFEKGVSFPVPNTLLTPAPPFSLQPMRWHHLVYTRGSANKLYHDGRVIFDDAGANGNPVNGVESFINIGDDPGGSGGFVGHICSVKVVASELTAQEVLAEARRTLSLGFAP